MAISASAKAVTNTNFSQAQTANSGAIAWLSGKRIMVFSTAMRWFHTTGLATDWAVSDDASTNSITWTQIALSAIDTDVGSNLHNQVIVWASSELTANETFTVTVDPHGSDTKNFYIASTYLEMTDWDGTLTQSVLTDQGSTTSGDVVFGSAPSGFQIIYQSMMANNTNVFSSPPTGWADLSGAKDEGNLAASNIITSTTNTDTTETVSFTTGGSIDVYWTSGFELNEVSGGVEVSGDLATETSTALEGTILADQKIIGDLPTETSTALDGSILASPGIDGDPPSATDSALEGSIQASPGITGELAASTDVALVGVIDTSGGITGELAGSTDIALEGSILTPQALFGDLATSIDEAPAGQIRAAQALFGDLPTVTDTALEGSISVLDGFAGEVAVETSTALDGVIQSNPGIIGELASTTDIALNGAISSTSQDPNRILTPVAEVLPIPLSSGNRVFRAVATSNISSWMFDETPADGTIISVTVSKEAGSTVAWTGLVDRWLGDIPVLANDESVVVSLVYDETEWVAQGLYDETVLPPWSRILEVTHSAAGILIVDATQALTNLVTATAPATVNIFKSKPGDHITVRWHAATATDIPTFDYKDRNGTVVGALPMAAAEKVEIVLVNLYGSVFVKSITTLDPAWSP